MPVAIISIFEGGQYERHVRHGAQTLQDGGLVVLPTETIYGAAGLLTQPAAKEKLRSLRPEGAGGPFTVHLADPHDALDYLDAPSDYSKRLINKLWPGPIGLSFGVTEARRN